MNLQEIFSRVLHMSLTGSYIILFVLLMRLALRKAPKVFSYVLWAAVLFRLLCPVSVSSVLSVLNFTPTVAAQPQGAVTTVEHPVILDIYMGGPIFSEEPEAEDTYQTPAFTPSFPEIRVDTAPVPDAVDQQAPAEPVRDPLRFSVTIWLLGMGVLFVYNIYTYARLSAKTAGAVRLRKNIYLGDHIPTPFVKGLIRPKIYLPSTLAEAERKYIIAHERCHIKRKDPLWKLLGYIALCIHWFNPLVWLAFVLSAKDMEMSCDEAVIGMYGPKIRAEYSASLLRLATGHRFIALTPLAFGEGDTKGRVMNMAKWKKPGFWAILCAAIVCIAVLAACATNPSEKEPQTETNPQAETNETTVPVTESTENLLQITEAEADKLCADALEQLKTAESYYILYEYESDGYVEPKGAIEYRRHGNNLLSIYSESIPGIGDWIIFDGKYGSFYGDFWVVDEEETTRNANDWLSKWSLEGKTVSAREVKDNTVTYEAAWLYELMPEYEYRGSLTYHLNNDGTLNHIARTYVLVTPEGESELTVDSITVMHEDPAATYAAIKVIADQCITHAELEEARYQDKLVSEIPSNKTQYDLDFALGAGQMRWNFHHEEFSCAIGAENPTPTGVTVFHTEADNSGGSFTADDIFWLEKLVDGKWQYVDEQKKEVYDQERKIDVTFYGTDRYTLDWSDSYGALEAGFYRVGRYYTARMPGAGDDTQVCYAKFRLYDEDQEELIKKCRNALEAFLSRKSFHVHVKEIPVGNVFTFFDSEDWKQGNNYLGRSANTRVDGNVDINGSMLRSGSGYSLSWVDGDVTKPLRSWETVDFIDSDDFIRWRYSFEIYDSRVIGAEENGNQISIYMEYDYHDNVFDKTEILFRFNEDGSLASAQKIRHCHDGSTVVDISMEILDTPEAEIKALIDSQDVSKPPVFSWAEDKDKYPNAQTEGFKNTTKSSVKSMEDALWFADQECTMPPQGPAGERYNIVEIAYDPDAGIWRVYLRFSQNIDGDQIIYINDDGITLMMVTTQQ